MTTTILKRIKEELKSELKKELTREFILPILKEIKDLEGEYQSDFVKKILKIEKYNFKLIKS